MVRVRRDIWSHALVGMGVGSVSGFVIHSTVQWGQQQRNFFRRWTLNRNTALASVLLGGCLGSFLCATTTGKNQVHQLYGIFAKAESPVKQQHPAVLDQSQRERNRLYRRASLTRSLQEQHGLSDAHGGHWYHHPHGDGDDEDEDDDTSKSEDLKSNRRQ